jgi:hypothetical protein
MFAIQTPQTIQLYGLKNKDGSPSEPEGSITFQHATDDVSRCQMIVAIEDRVYTFTFGTQGPIAETAYEDDETRKADAEREKQRQADEQKRREEQRRLAEEADSRELRTADDTTERDVAWDAPHVDPVPAGAEDLTGEAHG